MNFLSSPGSSASFTTPQSHCLTVLLELGDKPISLLDNICILLVLVVGPVCLDYAIDAVDCTWYPICGNKFGEVTSSGRMRQ